MWYVLQVKGGQELSICKQLKEAGYTTLSPRELRNIRTKGAWKQKLIHPVSELCIRGNGLQSRGLLQNNSDRRRSEVSRRPTLVHPVFHTWKKCG